jgi:hypothetical protein
MIVKFPKRIDPVMEIIIRNRREMREAEALSIASVHRTALRLRATAIVICLVYGILWLLAHP